MGMRKRALFPNARGSRTQSDNGARRIIQLDEIVYKSDPSAKSARIAFGASAPFRCSLASMDPSRVAPARLWRIWR